MTTQTSFREHINSSRETVSNWPSWKREVMGIVNRDSCTGSFQHHGKNKNSSKSVKKSE